MTRDREILQNCSVAIRRLKNECKDSGISEEEFRELYFESLESIKNDKKSNMIRKSMILILALFLCIALYYYKVIYTCVLCNLQEYIYPGLKIVRRLSIPFISLFPALTELYHESCLIYNPFFTVTDMDCWPCSHIQNVRQLYDIKPVTQQHVAPFIYETQQSILKIEDIQHFYSSHKNMIDTENAHIQINNKYFIQPTEMFAQLASKEKATYVWKFITMNSARLLRQLIPRPIIVPKFGQSTERFLIIDSSLGKVHIPDTECSFSFLISLSGSRDIHLEPAAECKHECKTLKVNLKESYLLWYNWWYWRPVIQATSGNDTLVAHLGSYC